MGKKLILAAHLSEIDGLEKITETVPNSRVLFCGVGLFEAMFNFQKYLAENEKPEEVILVGSAGCREKSDLFRIFICNRFQLPYYATEEIPDFIISDFTTTSEIAEPDVVTYSSFGISVTENPVKNADLTSEKNLIFLENMEAAGLAFICFKENIHFSAMLVATNTITSESRAQWKQNFKKAGQLLFTELYRILAK